MSGGFLQDSEGLTIWDGDRTVFTTKGRLVNFLPDENSYSFSAAFPDALKGKIGLFSYRSVWSPASPGSPAGYGWTSLGAAVVGARPQKWTDIIVLGPAPPGANLFLGRARLVQTLAPTHTWAGETISPPAFAGTWVPINGSMTIESSLGLARALSIYVANGSPGREGPPGNLVAYLDHSVSGQSGGFRQWGHSDPSVTPDNAQGGQNIWLGTGPSAQPVWFPTGSPGRKSSSGIAPDELMYWDMHRWNGSDPPTYSDPTNYASTYAVDVVGRFGRAAE